jgi:hypothetical protein
VHCLGGWYSFAARIRPAGEQIIWKYVYPILSINGKDFSRIIPAAVPAITDRLKRWNELDNFRFSYYYTNPQDRIAIRAEPITQEGQFRPVSR